jgi:hypothetical protein
MFHCRQRAVALNGHLIETVEGEKVRETAE